MQTFDEISMLPTDARQREAAMALLALERDIFGAWCRWLFRPLDDAGEQRAQTSFARAMQMVDDALGKVGGCGPFFLGDHISMVDLMFVPFMERQNASLLYWKGFRIRNSAYANIDRQAALHTLLWRVQAGRQVQGIVMLWT
jgi:glutathione S-transferase